MNKDREEYVETRLQELYERQTQISENACIMLDADEVVFWLLDELLNKAKGQMEHEDPLNRDEISQLCALLTVAHNVLGYPAGNYANLPRIRDDIEALEAEQIDFINARMAREGEE